MNYAEARKKIQARKPQDNYLVVELHYDRKLVLPYSEGIAFMAALQNAEQLNDPYGKRKTITCLEPDRIRCSVLSRSEYEQIRIAALLDVSLDDVRRYAMEAG